MDWKEKLESLKNEIASFAISDKSQVEEFRIQYLGSKGKLKSAMQIIAQIPNEAKREFGQAVNAIKKDAEEKWKSAQSEFSTSKTKKSSSNIDYTLPSFNSHIGTRHPISIVRDRMCEIFAKIGFSVAEGPEIEDDWHNFTALNTPQDHPARDMQDTFFLTDDKEFMLRTHTSSTQIRAMEQGEFPMRIITPGRVYRNETISARAHCMFHQIEGLYIDEGVSFADLKQCIYLFAKEMFQSEKIRLRPSYFPFTEPSAEVDISCFICNQEGCKVCKKTGWVEIGGCGMVDPAVFENTNIDTEKYSGFAFGMGIERIAMLLYQVDDIRLFTQNDIRFLEQFRSV